MSTAPAAPAKSHRRRLILAIVFVIVGVLALGAGAVFTIASQAASQPKPTVTGEPEPARSEPLTVTPTPTPTISTPSPTPTPTAMALPDGCLDAYPQEFLEEAHKDVILNHPLVVDLDVSKFADIETIRETLPGFECQWGGPSEGGVHTAVNSITPTEQIRMVSGAVKNGFDCLEKDGATLCQYSHGPTPDDLVPGDAHYWVFGEELYLRDGLLVTTWWAGTDPSIEWATQPVYDHLWPTT